MRRAHLKSFAAITALLPMLGLSSGPAPAAPSGDAQSCAALAGKRLSPDTVIESAVFKPDGDTVGNTKVTAPFCRVAGVARPTADSRIGFEVWLPPASVWNGRFQGEGSGGSAGSLSPGPMAAALRRGFATMSTDNGHLDGEGGGHGLSWAYGHPEKMIDWAWRGLHLSTVAAKQVIRDFYGKPAQYNYFLSCSAGGHHAIMEATRFPQDYDGLVGGAAPWKWTALMFGHTWNAMPALKDQSAVTPDSVAILNRKMVAACDRLDGVEDGVIADPRRCTVDPVQFQCKTGQSADCLTPVQVAAARHIYAGATRSDGTQLMPGQVRGTELGWIGQMTGPTPGGSSWEFWKMAAFQDPNFVYTSFDFDKDTARALNARLSNTTLGAAYDQTPDFDAFAKRGGKFLLFQGWADPVITPLMDVDFVNKVIARYGEKDAERFLRFFLLPGMGHCSGGVGYSHIGGATGAPVQDDADHDMERAIEAWVEKGRAPARLIAARMDADRNVTATQPVCQYPKLAQYDGRGDPKAAASYSCRDPGPMPPQPM
ncbi:MAG: tannase/feruloyl esterase family alpha/beta hydrolase [Alphaproteobacteria bacterium]|nr:tannase/feruloyl esterase family alpha/beta hydrolase [Alphaproteobacteria bacterium]